MIEYLEMTVEFAPKQSKREIEQSLGGADKADYRSNYPIYPDKGGHKERSRNNDTGQHDKHWKKTGK